MLDEYLVEECQLVTHTTNEYGDIVQLSTTTLNCRWRDIPTTVRGVHRENNDADSMVWFAADENVTEGSLLRFESRYYEVERITKAKRLGEADIQFLKCDVRMVDIGVS